ncbi:hypothetical protein ACQR14_23800, partial [Bradyrhizobium oligotrophicum]
MLPRVRRRPFGPPRINADGATVPRRNSFRAGSDGRGAAGTIWNPARLLYDRRSSDISNNYSAAATGTLPVPFEAGGWTMLPSSRRLDGAWMKLDDQGHLPADQLSADIYDSWMRCITLGLDALRPPSPEVVDAAVLRQEQQRCSLVRGLALAEMHTLHQQIAGSNFMIAFATAEGLLLDIISDSSFSDASDAACLRAGSIWTENVCGTNGLGTSAFLKRPIVVHGR